MMADRFSWFITLNRHGTYFIDTGAFLLVFLRLQAHDPENGVLDSQTVTSRFVVT